MDRINDQVENDDDVSVSFKWVLTTAYSDDRGITFAVLSKEGEYQASPLTTDNIDEVATFSSKDVAEHFAKVSEVFKNWQAVRILVVK